ncbi:inositol monophosphatase family protein [Candidatus Viridilinea mediisalina]|uniref:Inositol-1-monophosphatase n=1 Tax=Candidatus Viridilinea mediisalina TaxID=2024553 RepID=A0A2A6RM69_9CHLR|nr:inositol monophosphatase family protein [Candidatus Viridilinea mediisalina]PDW04147.1 inositol monophosphatase [Candidatus Viridilinea mediisalina]
MLNFVIDLALRAGAVLRARFAERREVTAKGFADVVTDADHASEALIVAAIRERFSDHAILAEEGGAVGAEAEYQWLVDPLDGTLNYLHGLPLFCVSLAVLRRGELHLAAVYDPMRDELFAAERGGGARCNGRKLQVSQTPTLAQALLTTGFPYNRFSQPDNNLREHNHLLLKAQDIRRPGSAALDLCAVAAGRSDAHWELGLSPWDVAAGALLVLEAGGTITNWADEPWHADDPRMVASNGLIHDELLRELASARREDVD